MTQSTPTITRRKLLGSTGAAGIVALGFRGSTVTADTPSYTDYTYAQPDGDDGPRLRVAWYSTYNDRVTNLKPTTNGTEEATGDEPNDVSGDGYDVETYGPLVAESNVLPGDSGTIALGLFAEEKDARVTIFPSVSGSLGEIVDLVLWYDTGLFGIGGCNGTGAIPDDPDVELTLAEFGRRYGSNGFRLRNGFGDCLSEGDRLCLGIAWKIDESVTNEWQDRSVEFELNVAAESCGGSQ